MNNTFNTTLSMDLTSLEDRSLPEDLFTINYTGVLTPTLLRRGALLAAELHVRRQRLEVHRSDQGHAARRSVGPPLQLRHVLRRLHGRGARQPGHLRQGHLLPVDRRLRLAQPDVRLRPLQRHPARQQPPVRQRLSHRQRAGDRRGHQRDCAVRQRHDARFSGIPSSSRARAPTSGRIRCSSTTTGA